MPPVWIEDPAALLGYEDRQAVTPWWLATDAWLPGDEPAALPGRDLRMGPGVADSTQDDDGQSGEDEPVR